MAVLFWCICLCVTSCEVEFAIAEMACVSRNIRTAVPAAYGIPVQRSISGHDVSHPRVELGLTGLTSTSQSSRTTCSKSLALLRSSVSVLSVRPRILVRMVFYFYSRILIGYLGILGLLRRRMVVVSHLFLHRRS